MKGKYVYVIYDPLYERTICVHELPEKTCRKCSVLLAKRNKEGQYQLEEHKHLLQTKLT